MSAAGRRAVTHCQEHTDVGLTAAWERQVHRASHVAPNSPDLNPVNCTVCGALQQMVYQRRRFKTINQLKQAIVTEWGKLLCCASDSFIRFRHYINLYVCMYIHVPFFGPPGSCRDSYKLLLAYLSWNKPNIAENWFSMPITECGVVILITEIYKATFYWSLRFEWHSRNRYSMQHVTDVKVFMFTAASTEYQESSSTSNVISQTSSPSSTVRSTTPGQSDSHQDVSGIIHISLLNMASGINIYSVFWISEIIILDIQNKVYHQLYSGYPE